MTTSRLPSVRASLGLLGLALFSVSAGAQSTGAPAVDPRFQPWLGCWAPSVEPYSPDEANTPRASTLACIVPSATVARSVDIVLFDSAKVSSRAAVPLPGTRTAKRVDDCSGEETATWSGDERRLVMHAELTCARGVRRVETGLMTVAPSGEWLQVQHLAVGENALTTVTRMSFREDSMALFARLGGGRAVSSASQRMAASAPLTTDAVLEVSKVAPVALTEAWIAELGQRFALNGKQLVQLADGGLPGRVIDLMVAVSHPEAFAVRPNGAPTDAMQVVGNNNTRNAARGYANCSVMDDFCYGPGGFGAWGLRRGFGGWDPYFMNSGYGFGNRFGYGNGYGYGFGNGLYYGNGPVIIVTRPPENVGDGGGMGRLVRGRGYTRGNTDASVGGPSPTRTSGGSGSMGGGSTTGGSMGGSAGSAGSAGGESTGRTAKPRGGGN